MHIHFICMGNSFRSIIAEAYAKSKAPNNYTFSSSGLIAKECKKNIADSHKIVVNKLKSEGLANHIKNNWGQQTSQDVIDKADLCVFMSKSVEQKARSMGYIFNKTKAFNVYDVNEGNNINNPKRTTEVVINDGFPDIIKAVDNLIYSK